MIANLLVAEGFTSIDELAEIELHELTSIEGFDEDVAAELQNRAIAWLEQMAEELAKQQKKLGLSEDLVNFDKLDAQTIVTLGEKGIKSLDDLADLAGDELVELLGAESLTEDKANEIIMAAREHWFEGEETQEAETAEETTEEASGEEVQAKAS